ncbi:MAG TPA: prepilin-type N-terminal cleavage/methylation domain-containing protein [Terriglobales bacterium]|nr:prepilin-type N-terminal cleavage/methylation domain-containing protein [Terriglobales bacterium]
MKLCGTATAGGPPPSRLAAGMSMLELMIAMAVLAVGMTAVTALFHSAILTNNRAKSDTSATMLAQTVLEKIAAQPATQNATISVTDCGGTPTTWTIATAGAAAPGNGATVDANSGAIDFTQAYANVPANYKMLFAGCGAGGRQTTFDVRWNVLTVSANTRLITVAARPLAATGGNRPTQFAPPITLRTIGGT